jgi:hypothetical protein
MKTSLGNTDQPVGANVSGKVAHASSVSPSGDKRTQDACTTLGIAPRGESTLEACATFFDPRAPIDVSSRNLPHWYQDGATYFVTFRLGDSIPQEKLRAWMTERQAWLERNPEPRSEEQWREYAERFTDRLHGWLDAGMGSCLLGKVEIGRVVVGALRFFDGERYHLGEWVVMPNHVHAIFQAIPPFTPKEILHSWKSYTANEINRREGRSGDLWQRESYDHLIRSPGELFHCVDYIRRNPEKAGLPVIVV